MKLCGWDHRKLFQNVPACVVAQNLGPGNEVDHGAVKRCRQYGLGFRTFFCVFDFDPQDWKGVSGAERRDDAGNQGPGIRRGCDILDRQLNAQIAGIEHKVARRNDVVRVMPLLFRGSGSLTAAVEICINGRNTGRAMIERLDHLAFIKRHPRSL